MPLRKRVRRDNFKAALPQSVAPTNFVELCQFSGAVTARRVTVALSPPVATAQIVALPHAPMPAYTAVEYPKTEISAPLSTGTRARTRRYFF
jgi:hypothetical protein